MNFITCPFLKILTLSKVPQGETHVFNLATSHKKIETKSFLGKFSGNSGMVPSAEISQAVPPYLMLQHIGSVAELKLAQKN